MLPRVATPPTDVHPPNDCLPIAPGDLHRYWTTRVIEILAHRYFDQPVYVSGSLLVQGDEGDPKTWVIPDVFVAKDCDPRRRSVYRVREEGKAPHFVLEVTSRRSQREDMRVKLTRYLALGVAEYFLYDPLGEWVEGLLGLRLIPQGGCVPLEPEADESVVSRELGIAFALEDGQLVLRDATTNERLLTGSERAAAAQQRIIDAEAEAWAARIQAGEAETRIRELEGQLARLAAERRP
jgi:Uma2 family endonuclease